MRGGASNAKLRRLPSPGAAFFFLRTGEEGGGAKQRAGALASPALFAHAACEKTLSRFRLDRFLQLFGGAEGHLLAGLDLDRLTGGGIATHARGALAHLQD